MLSCHSTTIVIPNEINPISKWFAMSVFSVLVENCFVYSLVWEWRENRVWKGCLVIRICTFELMYRKLEAPGSWNRRYHSVNQQ